MSRRIGILTFHEFVNEGAVLQALSLCRALEAHFKNSGAEVEVIDYRSRGLFMKDIRNIATRNLPDAFRKFKAYCRIKKFSAENLKLSREKFISDDYKKTLRWLDGKYDLIVVGSDEIWTMRENFVSRKFPNAFWLSPDLNCIKTAYAASANRTDFLDLKEEHTKFMKSTLDSFSLLGVRDDHTVEFLRYLGVTGDKKIFKISDPTFTLSLEDKEDARALLEKKGVDFKRPVVALMLHDPDLSRAVYEHFKAKGHQVVALSYNNRYCDLSLVGELNPLEWAMALKHFNICVTNRFHATIFCLKHKTPFVSVDRRAVNPRYSTKIYCLLKDFGLLDHYADKGAEDFTPKSLVEKMESVLKKPRPFDWDAKLSEKKEESRLFLQKMEALLAAS